MTYTPLKKEKPAIIISAILLLCASISLIFFALNIGNRLILQLIAVITAAEALSITSRYVLSGFTYTIELNNKIEIDKFPSFTVVKTYKTNKKTVCNLSLDTAIAVIPIIPLKEIRNKYGKILRKFNYCVNMFPDESYIYIYEVNGGINIIEIEANPDFYQMFKFMIDQQ